MDRFRKNLEPVGWLLDQSHNYPLLTPEQEILYGRHVQEWVELRDKETPTKRERRVIIRGRRAYEKFFVCNLRLVVKIVRQSGRKSGILETDDLVQEALVGLSRAIQKFDPTRGYKFSTYAYFWIQQSINRACDTHQRAIRVPSNALLVINRAKKFRERYKELHGKEPSMERIAREVFNFKELHYKDSSVERQKVEAKKKILENYLLHDKAIASLNIPAKTNDKGIQETSLIELLTSDDAAASWADEEELHYMQDVVRQGMKGLNDEEALVVSASFGLDTGEARGRYAVAREASVKTGKWIKRDEVANIRTRALRKMGNRISRMRAKERRALLSHDAQKSSL